MVDVLDIIPIPVDLRLRSLRLLIQKHSPVDSGDLRESWNDPRTVQQKPDGNVEIDNPLPYARIQDEGGDIPPYTCPPGKVMRAVIDGEVRFFTSRKGFRLPGSQYVSRAVQEWQNTPYGIGQSAGWSEARPYGVAALIGLMQAGIRLQKQFEIVVPVTVATITRPNK